MKKKKNEQGNLEKKRGLFLQLGFIIALSSILLAFEWATYDVVENIIVNNGSSDFEEEFMPITVREKKPKVPRTLIIQEAELSDDDEEDDMEWDTEMEEDDEVKMNEPEESDTEEFEGFRVDKLPVFKNGGEAGMLRFIRKNVIYPFHAKENGEEGKVLIGFVITNTGAITKVHALNKVHPDLEREAIRVVKMMPTWHPGKQASRSVFVKMMLPVVFELR